MVLRSGAKGVYLHELGLGFGLLGFGLLGDGFHVVGGGVGHGDICCCRVGSSVDCWANFVRRGLVQ